MEALLLGLSNLLDTHVIIAILIGAIGGVVIGAIPGIGPAIAIAILLPATIFLEDLVSLVLLLGIYGSAMYGGAIPAILINTPGTPVNALTTYDGYSMTKNGDAPRALSLAYSSSFFGGCFSISIALICLIVFGPYLRDFGALFGQRDIFMAAALGSVLLILAHRQNMAIAAMLFALGFLISMVGRQTSRGVARYTFEIEYLASGFNLIVVIVGIFALSQALNLMNGKDTDPPETKITKGLFKGLAELKKYPAVAFISASFGTVMGIIPGVGEFVAQFFSYSTARSLSKNPSKFGYGAPEGLIACETSNNAVPAAAMIPLLALGVPGEALTAMMMVVFFDAGIKPGPDIFEKAPDFLFSLFIALLFINILVVITLLFTSRFIAKIIYIPNKFLGAFIMILAFVGVFSIRNNFVDCAFAAGFGLLGYILRRLNWPLVPIVLGMVLGSIMIEKLTAGASKIKFWSDIINRPVSGTLAFIIFLVIIVTLISYIRNYNKNCKIVKTEKCDNIYCVMDYFDNIGDLGKHKDKLENNETKRELLKIRIGVGLFRVSDNILRNVLINDKNELLSIDDNDIYGKRKLIFNKMDWCKKNEWCRDNYRSVVEEIKMLLNKEKCINIIKKYKFKNEDDIICEFIERYDNFEDVVSSEFE